MAALEANAFHKVSGVTRTCLHSTQIVILKYFPLFCSLKKEANVLDALVVCTESDEIHLTSVSFKCFLFCSMIMNMMKMVNE